MLEENFFFFIPPRLNVDSKLTVPHFGLCRSAFIKFNIGTEQKLDKWRLVRYWRQRLQLSSQFNAPGCYRSGIGQNAVQSTLSRH